MLQATTATQSGGFAEMAAANVISSSRFKGGSLMGAYQCSYLRGSGLVFCTTAATGDGLRLSPWDDVSERAPDLAFFWHFNPELASIFKTLARGG